MFVEHLEADCQQGSATILAARQKWLNLNLDSRGRKSTAMRVYIQILISVIETQFKSTPSPVLRCDRYIRLCCKQSCVMSKDCYELILEI